MKRFLLSLAAFISFALPAFAAIETLDFTYDQDLGPTDYYGFNKLMSYDVAIKIADPVLTGTQVTGLRVDFPVDAADVTDITGWMSTELRAVNNKNVANIAEETATLSGGILSLTFSEPYTIPSQGVYVGYSFTISNGAPGASEPGPGYPILIAPGNDPDGFFLRTSSGSRQQWTSMAEGLSYVSGMVVSISAEVKDDDAIIILPDKIYSVAGKDSMLPVEIINRGSNPVREIEYTYSAGETTATQSYNLPTPLVGFGDATTVELSMVPFPEIGSYDFSLSVDKVNGTAVSGDNHKAASNLDVLAFMPVKRPLVEEYTGLRCGFCPRGYVAMEEMSESLGDMFVGLAYHTETYESEMVTVSNSQFPMSVSVFPNGDIDRRELLDPGYFQTEWPSYSENFAPADINVAIDWVNDSKTEFAITATAKFAKNIDNSADNYRLAIALVADNVYNEQWAQSNNYAGNHNMPDTYHWNLFTKEGTLVKGLKFNDVVAYFKNVRGIQGSLPASINHSEEHSYSYSIIKEDVKTIRNKDFLNVDALVHAVAILVDTKTGLVLNCNKSASLVFGEESGVAEINSDAEVLSVRYYDMQGHIVANPASGLYIKEEKLSDGTTHHTKILL